MRGLIVAATGIGLWVASVIFGAEPLGQLGFGLLFLSLVALAVVRLGRHDVAIERTISPERARVHQPVTVTLALVNKGRGPAPLLLLEDRLPAGLSGKARFSVHGIEVGGHRETSFVVDPDRRGRYQVGPLQVEIVDPFGLAKVRSRGASASTFLVHPRTEQLSLPRDFGERRSVSVAALRQPTGATGEDFYTLREYAQGDDLRKIHWPSTAKRGKYMIRQEETPWHTRATLLVDDRLSVHGGFGETSSFERAIETIASLVSLYHSSGYSYRLAGAHDPGMAGGKGSHHFHRCLDLLAVIEPAGPGPGKDDPALLSRLAEIEARAGAEDTLVVVAGTVSPAEAIALSRCRRMFKQVIVVSWPAHRFTSVSTKARWEGEKVVTDAVHLMGRSGIRALVLGPGDRLGPAWSSMSSGTTRGGDGWDRKPELV